MTGSGSSYYNNKNMKEKTSSSGVKTPENELGEYNQVNYLNNTIDLLRERLKEQDAELLRLYRYIHRELH